MLLLLPLLTHQGTRLPIINSHSRKLLPCGIWKLSSWQITLVKVAVFEQLVRHTIPELVPQSYQIGIIAERLVERWEMVHSDL